VSDREIPSWACKRWGGYEHDWLNCPDCIEKYEATLEEEPLYERQNAQALGPTQAPVHQEQAPISGNGSEPETNSASEVSRCEIS
jgi:hypothetical protein